MKYIGIQKLLFSSVCWSPQIKDDRSYVIGVDFEAFQALTWLVQVLLF